MAITLNDVKHIASLSRLKFSQQEEQQMQAHLETVLTHFEKLDSVDTSSVSATAHILDKVNVLREDVIMPSMAREILLKNAPEEDEGYYIVPKVLD